MALTLQDISKELNLSISTISRVLNNKPNVNTETRELVLIYLKDHQYISVSSSKTANKTNDIVAVVIPDLTEDYFANVVRGIEDNLWNEGGSMMLCDTVEDAEKEAQYMNMLIKKKFSGIILATVDKNQGRLDSYLQKGINIVFFDNLPNITINYNSVITDNVKASKMAVDHFISMGHTHIGVIAGKQEETTGFERLVGYRRAMELNGIAVDEHLIAYGDFKEESGYTCMNRLKEENPNISAVLVSSAKMTYGAMKAIYDMGLSIPEDISVIGFDVHDPTELIRPGITSIMQNETHIGRICVELLRRCQSHSQVNATMLSQRILLEPQLVIRESCGFNKHSQIKQNA